MKRKRALKRIETSDFWDELSPEQQFEVNQAIKELDEGKGRE